MNTRSLTVLFIFAAMILGACTPQVVTQIVQQTQIVHSTAVVNKANGASYPASVGSGGNGANEAFAQANPTSASGTAVPDASGSASIPSTSRMIIKDGNINLLVVDTDVALDRVTQVVSDTGGYIVSSRVWYTPVQDKNYKNATLTVGVPVDQFEPALVRLRAIAKQVLDETESGTDVTDQYVDLQSQLVNLQASRDRIRGFLDKATTVDEILKINDQLTQIEQQIETIQGKQKYLADRSSYSTLTITLTPDIPTATPSPTPTPTPVAGWNPGHTFIDAGNTLGSAYKVLIDAAIWVLVVFVPIVAPVVLVIWLIAFLTRRGRKPAA
jgi:hypothetical protein